MADDLTADLEASPAIAALATDTVNKTKRWVLTFVPAAAEALGDLYPSLADGATLTLSTGEAKVLLAGLKAGAAVRPAAVRRASGAPRGKNPYREAIAASGRVEATIPDPNDPASIKRTRDAVFAAAYGLGLKGQFKVTRDGDLLIGEKVDAA